MIKVIKRSFFFMMVLVAMFTLASCNGEAKKAAQAALDEFTEQVTFANTAEVTTSFMLAARGKKGEYNIPISWESSNPDVIKVADLIENGEVSTTFKNAKVTRPNKGEGDATVTLTATFTVNYTETKTLTATKEFVFTVLEEVSAVERGTIASIKEAAAKFYFTDNGVKPGTSSSADLEFPVEFDATVTAVLGANGAGQFAVSDGTAGIYVHSNKLAVKVGDKVHVKGSVTTYYGILQVGANVEVTAETFDTQNIEFKETTIQAIHDQTFTDGMYGGQTLTVTGKLLFGQYNGNTSDSFWLEDGLTGAQVLIYYKSYTAEEEAALKEYVGKFVNVNIVTYDKYSSYAPYNSRAFVLTNTIKETTAPTLSDAEKLAQAVNKVKAVTLEDTYYNGDAFAFPTVDVAEGVNVAWSIEPAALLVDGKLVITADGKAAIKAVVTCGSASETVTLEFNVAAELKVSTVKEALGLADGANVIVQGVVTAINTAWNEQYGNISVTVSDKTGSLYVYRLATNVTVGQTIKITGKMGSYNGAKQIAAGATAEIIAEAPSVVAVSELAGLADGTKVMFYATVKSIDTAWSEQYGNISVTVEADGATFYVYRLSTNVQVGDKLVIVGEVGSYKEAKQIAAGSVAGIITE